MSYKKKEDFLGTVDESLHTYQTYEKSGLIWLCLSKPRYSAEFFLKHITDPLEKYKLEEMDPIEANDFLLSHQLEVMSRKFTRLLPCITSPSK